MDNDDNNAEEQSDGGTVEFSAIDDDNNAEKQSAGNTVETPTSRRGVSGTILKFSVFFWVGLVIIIATVVAVLLTQKGRREPTTAPSTAPSYASYAPTPNYLQIGDWIIARTCETCSESHLSISSQAHGKTSQVFLGNGTLLPGPQTDFNAFDLTGGTGPISPSKLIVFGDRAVQIRDWRIRQVQPKLLSVTNENGNVSRIYRSDGTVHDNIKEWSGYINEDLGKPTCAYLTSSFLQLGDWRFGEMGGHLSVTHKNGQTATIYVHDGTVHPGPRTDLNAWTLVDDEVLAGTKEGCHKDYLPTGDWRIARTCETCSFSRLSISSKAHGQTSQVFRDDGTYQPGPQTDFNAFDLTGEQGVTRASIVFGDKAVQIRDWRIRQVDSNHLSVTNENGNVSRIYRSDGTVLDTVLDNIKEWSGYIKEDLGEPTCAYLTSSFLQLGDWRFGEMGGHLSVTHKNGQTATIYVHDGTVHPGPRTDLNAWTLVDDEVLAGTKEGCHEDYLPIGDWRIARTQLGDWLFGEMGGHLSVTHKNGQTVGDDTSFPGLSTHSSTSVINDSTECLNLTVSILTPQVTHHNLSLSWGLYDGSDCVDTPNWLDSNKKGCDWYIGNQWACDFNDGGLGVANDNCCTCNQFHTAPKLWGEKSILITPNNTFDCVDTPNWEDKDGKGCDAYGRDCPDPSEAVGEFLRHEESVRENCCACGGGTTSLRSNSIIIRNAIESNVCLAKDETYRFQVRAHGWTSVKDTLGHSAIAYALSSHDNQIACGQFDVEIEDNDFLVLGAMYLKLQSNFSTIVTVNPTNNTHSGCTSLDGRDIGRGIELLPLKCYYDSREDGLFTRNNAWKGSCSETSRLNSSCSSVYRIGPDESKGYCKFEEYHQFVSDVGGGVPFSPSSAQGECLWEVWDYDFGNQDPARIEFATCCRSGLGSEGDLTTLSCECSVLQDCSAGKTDKCSAYAAVCCEDASCKCDYKRRACRFALENELSTGEEAPAGDVCQDDDSICSFGQEPSIGGYECDFWEPLCRELPNSKSACSRADEVCCGSKIISNPHCTCDFLTFTINELGYDDTKSKWISCAEASTLYSSKSEEKQSLMNLHSTTDGLNWLNSTGWLDEESDHCSWAGISCNPDGHVNEINLHANNLSRSFPAHLLRGLTHLERIDLADNKLSGQMSAYVIDDRLFGAEGKCRDANGAAYSTVQPFVPINISSVYEYCYDICQDISTNEKDLVGLQTNKLGGRFTCACLYNNGALPQADPAYFIDYSSDVESTESCYRMCKNAVQGSPPFTIINEFFLDEPYCLCIYDEEFAGTTLHRAGLINGRFMNWIDDNNEGNGPVASAGDSCSTCEDYRCYPLQRPSYKDFAFLSSLRKLKHIDISNNQLSGQFDALLAPSLEYLNASHNNFTSLLGFRSYKPSHKTLRTLDLGTNSIQQNLSTILSNVPPNLVQLSLANNTIRGSFPLRLDSLESLQQFDISSNVISGSLPDFSRTYPSLQVLNLSDNARTTNGTGLTGNVPASISNLAFLKELHLRNNRLSGGLAGLGGMSQIKKLDLSANQFTGTVPLELGSLAGTIDVLDLSDNKFEGTIPTEIGLFQPETQISLSNNAFERASCSSCALAPLSLCSIDGFDMIRDEALCPLERSILRDFYILAKGNEWTYIAGWMGEHGSYCDWKGVTCDNNEEGKGYIDQHVIRLELPNNGLSGKLSPRIGNLTQLEALVLSDNDIKGEFPVEISNLIRLKVLRLSYNALVGTFPSELGLLEHLEIVHLHSNRIQGNLTIRNYQTPYESFYEIIQRESHKLPDSPEDAFDKAMFIADCGSPSAFDEPVNCPTCTMCCNSQEDCYPQTTPSLLESSGFDDFESLSWVFALSVVVLCVFAWLGASVVDYVKNRSDPSTFQKLESMERLDTEAMEMLDTKYAIETIGVGSVYSFLLSSNIGGWLIALVTIGLQTLMLLPFILAADFDLANDNSDLVYTWKCNRDGIICKDKNDLSKYMWVVFGVLMVAFLSKDVCSGAKMILLAGKQRHSTQRRVKFFTGGTFLVSITLFVLYVSTIYNKTIATSNTDLIINSVAILFIMEIDERVYELIENTNFVRMKIRNDIDEIDSNEDGGTDGSLDGSDMESLLSEFNAFRCKQVRSNEDQKIALEQQIRSNEDQKIALEQQQSQINSLLEMNEDQKILLEQQSQINSL